ncbi:hypothetical protein ACHAWF_003132 [Thalassiosira exigua]
MQPRQSFVHASTTLPGLELRADRSTRSAHADASCVGRGEGDQRTRSNRVSVTGKALISKTRSDSMAGCRRKARTRAAAAALASSLLLRARQSTGFSPPPPAGVRRRLRGASASRLSPPRTTTALSSIGGSADAALIDADASDDEPCLAGENVVASCEVERLRPTRTAPTGTQSRWSASINLGKCICGAGSFALPHVFLEEGALGGALAMTTCAYLAATTMKSINDSRMLAGEDDPTKVPPTSYVELTAASLGEGASKVVFALTLAASLGVCSTYVVFVGQTLASLSADALSNNAVHAVAPDVDERAWEIVTAATVLPLSLVRNYGIFAFTSALGVTAVLGGILVTLAYGVLVDPGGGAAEALSAVSQLKLWPDSFSDAFGGSFGTIAYLFCVNFLTFPIINSMKDPRNDYDEAVSSAVSVVWTVNVIFAIVCLGFYGADTQDLVLANLDNGPYLSALKILLCVDLLFTFPVVFSSGRQILENALLSGSQISDDKDDLSLAASRAAVTGGGVAVCFGLSQVGGFGVVANLVGGVAQGTLAFIIPPAIAIALSRRRSDGAFDSSEVPQWLIGGFGVAVVSSVTYFTLVESLR